MSILGKVKKLVGAEEGAEEKKPRARKAAAEKPATEKKAPAKAKKVAVAAVEAAHDHDEHDGHDHSGHDHGAVHAARPIAVEGAIGNGAAKYIVRPLVTEKGTRTAEHNTHMFEVLPTANKRAIKEAIEKIYGVSVIRVHTSRMDGKKVGAGRNSGSRSNTKKAFVTLAKGQTISLFKGV